MNPATSHVLSELSLDKVSLARLFAELSHLEAVYPGFGRWYWGKMAPGLSDGTRKAIQATKDGVFEGIVIAKRTSEERKLCTLWTTERSRGSGIGTALFSEALDWLQDSSPVATVPAERIDQFGGLLRGQGFALTGVVDSMYRPGAKEFIFNHRPRNGFPSA